MLNRSGGAEWQLPPFFSTARLPRHIEDGWSLKLPRGDHDTCWGDDYRKSNSKFGDMQVVADAIKKLGMRPGLWTRTLLANQRPAKWKLNGRVVDFDWS